LSVIHRIKIVFRTLQAVNTSRRNNGFYHKTNWPLQFRGIHVSADTVVCHMESKNSHYDTAYIKMR